MKKSAHFTTPYVSKYNDNPSPDKYQPDQTNTVITELPRAADRNARSTEKWFEDKQATQQPMPGSYEHQKTYEYNNGTIEAGALNANKSAHFTAPYIPKYNDNPSPDKYQPDQTHTVITELPRAADRTVRSTEAWFEDKKVLTQPQPG